MKTKKRPIQRANRTYSVNSYSYEYIAPRSEKTFEVFQNIILHIEKMVTQETIS
jgi:hypothetical protein